MVGDRRSGLGVGAASERERVFAAQKTATKVLKIAKGLAKTGTKVGRD